jgi:hypothetical protein
MSDMVITAHLTEGLAATPSATIGANSHSAVSTRSHSTIAARTPDVAVTADALDLAMGIHNGSIPVINLALPS